MSFVVAFAAGGCSGKDHGPGVPENPGAAGSNGAAGSGANPGAGSGPNQSAAGGKGSPANAARPGVPAAVNRILDLAHKSDGASFTATYRVRMPDGKRATSTLAQKPPKFGFHLTNGTQRNVVVSDGTRVTGCLSSGKGWRCSASTADDDATEVGTTYPQAILQLLDGLTALAGREVKLGTTTRTVQGSKVDCATFTANIQHPPSPQVFCIRKDGVLAYARTSDQQVVQLTSFKTSVDSSLMTVPR